MDPLTFFWLFLKASLFSTGGLGNLPFLHKDLLAARMAGESDFVTAIAVGQMSPGPTGLWSISLGYLTYGWPGAGLALLALSLPPLAILGVAAIYSRIERLVLVQDFMRGFTLGVVGLTLGVAWALASAAIADLGSLAIMLAALGLALSKRVPVIGILAGSAALGWLLYGR